jgi:hypothetical protein
MMGCPSWTSEAKPPAIAAFGAYFPLFETSPKPLITVSTLVVLMRRFQESAFSLCSPFEAKAFDYCGT